MKLRCEKGWKMEMKEPSVTFLQGRGKGRGDRSAPRGLKIAPRGSQDPPRQPQGVQIPLRRLPKKPPRPSQQSSFSSVLKNNCFNMNIFVGSSPRSCQDQHIRATELLSLHASQPPSLRVPAANCLGGIREAQTIF